MTALLEKTAREFRLLSDPTRLKILKLLFSERRDFCVNEIADHIGATHSATSHQLAKLEAYNIVECYRDGKTICYERCDNPRTRLIQQLFDVTKL